MNELLFFLQKKTKNGIQGKKEKQREKRERNFDLGAHKKNPRFYSLIYLIDK